MATGTAVSNASETAILKLIFQAVTWTDYGVSAGSGTPETNIALALHTADPADAGNMSTSEMSTGAYAGYGRVNVARTTGGWTETTGTITPVANIDFPAGTGGTGATATFFSTGHTGSAGSAQPILWSGAISPTIACGNGVTPRLTTATTISLD
jgi:hypothetical protein